MVESQKHFQNAPSCNLLVLIKIYHCRPLVISNCIQKKETWLPFKSVIQASKSKQPYKYVLFLDFPKYIICYFVAACFIKSLLLIRDWTLCLKLQGSTTTLGKDPYYLSAHPSAVCMLNLANCLGNHTQCLGPS